MKSVIDIKKNKVALVVTSINKLNLAIKNFQRLKKKRLKKISLIKMALLQNLTLK